MISDYFNYQSSWGLWYNASQNDKPVPIPFYVQEKLTQGTYNLDAIGIKNPQGMGIWSELIFYLKEEI